jgi:hypothetical protein
MDIMQYEIPTFTNMPSSWFSNNKINGKVDDNDKKPEPVLNPKEKIILTFKESVTISRKNASPIFKISNLLATFETYKKDETKKLFGNFYILDLDCINSHFHFVNDEIGEYLAIKEVIKDVKLLVVVKEIGTIKKNLKDHGNFSKLVYDILSKLEIFENKIINLNEFKALSIENLFATQNYFNNYVDKNMIFENNGNHPKTTVPALRKLFIDEEALKVPANKKIFISRKQENNKSRQLREIWDSLSVNNERSFKIFKSKIGNDFRIKIIDRFISLSDEEDIEKFFVNNGYEIVSPGDYSFEEQIKIFSSATHVAGLSGAGFINTIFCRPGTKVIILNTSNRYTFPHHRWPSEAGMKTLSVPEIIGKSNKDFSAKDIIEDISKRGIRV